MKKSVYILTLALLNLLIHRTSLAAENARLDAHFHGLSELTIAVDKHNLEIEIRSPASNIVGFEHTATSSTDIAKVTNAISLLHQHQTLFLISGRSCKLLAHDIDVAGITAHSPSATEHGHQHKDDGLNHNHQAAQHSEISAYYRYQCQQTSATTTITVNAFELFAGIEQIQAMWVNENQQGAATLNAKNKVITLK